MNNSNLEYLNDNCASLLLNYRKITQTKKQAVYVEITIKTCE